MACRVCGQANGHWAGCDNAIREELVDKIIDGLDIAPEVKEWIRASPKNER